MGRATVLLLSCFAGVLAEASSAFAQSTLPLPDCEPPLEVRKALGEKLGWKLTGEMTVSELLARRRDALARLAVKYPREIEPQRRLILETRWWADPDQLPALVESYRKQAAQNPDDPLALFLAGLALFHTDTPESIRLLEAARAVAPKFPWTALELAEIYSGGKHAEQKRASENIAAFFAACPGSTDPQARRLLEKAGDAALQAQVATGLRTRLAKESDPARLKDYATLWGLEFRSRPPQQHDALRKQVAEDVKRLESLNPKADASQLALIVEGYEQSGASAEIVNAVEDRLLWLYPKSEEACLIVLTRWQKKHKEPEDQTDAAGWAKYNKSYEEALKSWIKDSPDVPFWRIVWFYAISDERDDTISEGDGIAGMEAYRQFSTEHDIKMASKNVYQPLLPWQDFLAAEFLMRHRWQPERAMALLRDAEAPFANERERRRQDDDLTSEQVESLEGTDLSELQELASLMLDAAKLVDWPGEALALKASIEGPLPKEKRLESRYWWNRAKLAALEGRQVDALAYYQMALQKRLEKPRPFRGKVRDDLTEEAWVLWKEMGGSETAWAAWSKPAPGGVQELTEVHWEKPQKQLPPFELADLSGKIWRSKELAGKSLMINLWATWCGPCAAELLRLQKMYEKVKDRTDIQILTFNVDENLGLVAPFLKEKGYTFPVLPANGFVMSLLGGIGIPQNWIVDPKGTWRWVESGFDAGDPDWMENLIQRMESVRTSD